MKLSTIAVSVMFLMNSEATTTRGVRGPFPTLGERLLAGKEGDSMGGKGRKGGKGGKGGKRGGYGGKGAGKGSNSGMGDIAYGKGRNSNMGGGKGNGKGGDYGKGEGKDYGKGGYSGKGEGKGNGKGGGFGKGEGKGNGQGDNYGKGGNYEGYGHKDDDGDYSYGYDDDDGYGYGKGGNYGDGHKDDDGDYSYGYDDDDGYGYGKGGNYGGDRNYGKGNDGYSPTYPTPNTGKGYSPVYSYPIPVHPYPAPVHPYPTPVHPYPTPAYQRPAGNPPPEGPFCEICSPGGNTMPPQRLMLQYFAAGANSLYQPGVSCVQDSYPTGTQLRIHVQGATRFYDRVLDGQNIVVDGPFNGELVIDIAGYGTCSFQVGCLQPLIIGDRIGPFAIRGSEDMDHCDGTTVGTGQPPVQSPVGGPRPSGPNVCEICSSSSSKPVPETIALAYFPNGRNSLYQPEIMASCRENSFPDESVVTAFVGGTMMTFPVSSGTAFTIMGPFSDETQFEIQGWGSCTIQTSCSAPLVVGDQIGPFLVVGGNDCQLTSPTEPTIAPVPDIPTSGLGRPPVTPPTPRVVQITPLPTPNPTPEPTPFPTPNPTPEPTPAPTPRPSCMTPEPTPAPTPGPTMAPIIPPIPRVIEVTRAPVSPAPVSPEPTTSAPVSPGPTPAPVTPSPISPAPVTLAPTTSAPVTSAPITPLPTSPSSQPTETPCLELDMTTYQCGENISISFNLDSDFPALVDDWIGIYPCNTEIFLHANVWQWACGDVPGNCTVPVMSATRVFDKLLPYNEAGPHAWPVAPFYEVDGSVNRCFKASYLRADGPSVPPYIEVCGSAPFEIIENDSFGCDIQPDNIAENMDGVFEVRQICQRM